MVMELPSQRDKRDILPCTDFLATAGAQLCECTVSLTGRARDRLFPAGVPALEGWGVRWLNFGGCDDCASCSS